MLPEFNNKAGKYKITITPEFEKRFFKIIPKSLQKQTLMHIQKLSENPYMGKPLCYSFIRDLKFKKFRIYFLVYEQEIQVLLVDVSDKKHQQEIIDFIQKNRTHFMEIIKNLNNK